MTETVITSDMLCIKKMPPGTLWVSARAGIERQEAALNKAMTDLLEADVPGYQDWMTPRRYCN